MRWETDWRWGDGVLVSRHRYQACPRTRRKSDPVWGRAPVLSRRSTSFCESRPKRRALRATSLSRRPISCCGSSARAHETPCGQSDRDQSRGDRLLFGARIFAADAWRGNRTSQFDLHIRDNFDGLNPQSEIRGISCETQRSRSSAHISGGGLPADGMLAEGDFHYQSKEITNEEAS